MAEPVELVITEPVKLEAPKKDSKPRRLAIGWGGSRVEEFEDGKVIVKDITLLSEGTWTDSAVGTPLFYPASTLEKFAANWTYRGLWNRHAGGDYRNISDRLGRVENPRFDSAKKAIVADLMFYGITEPSKSAANLAKASVMGSIDPLAVSVEHYWDEGYVNGKMCATQLEFMGLAMVEDGACEDAKLLQTPAQSANEPTKLDSIIPNPEKEEIKMAETVVPPTSDPVKELETKYKADIGQKETIIAELTKKIETLNQKVKELENVPVQTVAVSEGSNAEADWTSTVVIDKNSGTIRGV